MPTSDDPTTSVPAPDPTGSLADPARTGAYDEAPAGPPAPPAPPDEPGLLAGRYRLGEPLGEGGMGSVFRAEQLHPVRRAVAVKLIRAGMDSARVVARFEAERQALAVMDHPNIAKVLDAGTTPEGRPFFAMELVAGTPLTDYCDAAKLTVPDRLRLFVPVCQAVQHAHQKGVIHRDLKPGNILVTEVDGKPVPRVIDFGLAKALDAGVLPDVSLDGGSILGTPLYMAPEQADPGAADIDTRADVYALGVILYELLTGGTPIARATLKAAALAEVLRVIREHDPPTPVRRLESADALPSIAAVRGIEPARLRKLVRGDLEWVTMKCLEKDRARRYDTANALALEVQRFLADEPVSACPPSRWYKGRKFVKRNRGPVIAAALVLVALLAGFAGTAYGMVEANRQKREAVAARDEAVAARDEEARAKDRERARAEAEATERKRAEKAEADARAESHNTTAVTNFFRHGILATVAPQGQAYYGLKLNPNITVREVLGAVAAKVTAGLREYPRPHAMIEFDVGVLYNRLGQHDKAVEHLSKSLEIRTAHFGPDHRETLTTMSVLGVIHSQSGNTKAALLLYDQLFAAHRRLNPGQPDDPVELNNLARTYQRAGRPAEAVPVLEKARAVLLEKNGPADPTYLIFTSNLALAYQDVGRVPEAVALFQQVRDAFSANPKSDPVDTFLAELNLASAHSVAGNEAAAIAGYERMLGPVLEKLGPEHPIAADVAQNLSAAYQKSGATAGVVRVRQAVWVARRKLDGPHAATTLAEARALLPLAEAAGVWGTAVELRTELLALSRKAPKPNPAGLASELVQLGAACLMAKQYPAAEAALRERLALREKTEPDEWTTFNTRSALGGALLEQKKYADAEPLLLSGFEGMQARLDKMPLPARYERIEEAIDRLVEFYAATKKPDEAAKWRAERARRPALAPPPRAVKR